LYRGHRLSPDIFPRQFLDRQKEQPVKPSIKMT
jgi:hypothetical protein